MKTNRKKTKIRTTLIALIGLLVLALVVRAGTDDHSTSLTVGNAVPVMSDVFVVAAVDLAPGSIKNAFIRFNVTDSNGYTDINITAAIVNVTLNNELSRTNMSGCNWTTDNLNSIIFNCTVEFYYYDLASADWEINVSISDNSESFISATTVNITVNSLDDILFNDTAISCGTGLAAGSSDNKCDVLNITNRGNQNYISLNETAHHLDDDSTSAFTINPGNFTMNITVDSTQGIALSNGTETFLGNTSLRRANASSKSRMTLWMYVDIPSGTPVDTYSSIANWQIEVVSG